MNNVLQTTCSIDSDTSAHLLETVLAIKDMDKRASFLVVILAALYFCCFKDGFNQGFIKGKCVLITGGSSGIGEQLAYHYSRLGARVFIAARRENLLEEVAKKCEQLGAQQVELVTSDLAIQEDRTNLVAEVKKRFGRLDHLILNHAVLTPRLWPWYQKNMTTFRNELDNNFFSFVDLASQFLPMLTVSKGSIGVVSSVNGKVPFAGLSSYSTSKFQINGFFSALRQELHYRNTGVSVTVCILGAIKTDIIKYSEEKKQELLNLTWGFDMRASPESAATAIISGVVNHKYEIYYPTSAFLIVAIHHLFPGYVEDIIGGVILDFGLDTM